MGRLTRKDVSNIVREHLRTGVTITGDESFEFVLYDACVVRVLADEYGTCKGWGLAIYIGRDNWVQNVFGESLSLRETPEQITAALDAIDYWCRLRLGTDYVEAWKAANPPLC